MTNISPFVFSKISSDITYLRDLLLQHQGDIGETVHGIPSDGLAGFMPYSLYQSSNQLFTTRKYITGADLNTLPAGFYYGSSLLNIPPDAEEQALATIDISVFENSRKKIVYTQSWRNLSWTKMLHVPLAEVSSRGWFENPNQRIIWKGAVSEVNSVQSLTDYIKDFKYLEILYTSTTGNTGFIKVSTKNLATCTLSSNNIPDNVVEGGKSITNTECILDFTTANKFSIKANHGVIVSDSTPSEANVKIVINEIIAIQ